MNSFKTLLMNSKLQQACDFDHTRIHLHSSYHSSTAKTLTMPGLLRLNSVGEDLPVSHMQKIETSNTSHLSFGSIFTSQLRPLKKSLTAPLMSLAPMNSYYNYSQPKNLLKLDVTLDHKLKDYQPRSFQSSLTAKETTFHSHSASDLGSGCVPFSKITKLLQPDMAYTVPKIVTGNLNNIMQSISEPSLASAGSPVYTNMLNNFNSFSSKTMTASEPVHERTDTSDCLHYSISSSDSRHSDSSKNEPMSMSEYSSHCANHSIDQQAVLLAPRKIVKKGRPSSKKRRKRQRQKQKHLENSPPKESVFQCLDRVPITTSSECKTSTPVKTKSKSSKLPCVLFTLLSDSDQSDSEDSCSDWSFCDSNPTPIKDSTFNFALSLDAIFKQKNIPSLESVFSSPAIDNTSDSVSFVSLCDVSSCDQVVDDEAMKEINAKWEQCYPSAGFRSCTTVNKDKIENPLIKVRFAAEPELFKIYLVETEDRCGTWQHYALDRDRFERRIQEASAVISPVLGQLHRARIVERNAKLNSV